MDLKNQLIEEYVQIILKNIFQRIGRKNIVSVFLIGSTARNNAKYKEVNGNLYLESDLDLLIIVYPKSLLKSLLLVKHIAKDVTLQLNNEKLLSHVSLSVTSENSLKNSKPSIFYQDLCLNGKLVYGKNLKPSLVKYTVNDIPLVDFYRLVFNRMVEFLSVFVSSGYVGRTGLKNDFDLVRDQLGKLIFALIQALLFKEMGILILRGFNLDEIDFDKIPSKQSTILEDLIKNYETYTSSRQSEINQVEINEKSWNDIIRQVRLTLELLSTSEDSSPNLVKKLFEHKESGIPRLRSSLIIFLQYVKICKTSEILRTILYNLKFGQDYVYIPLYTLFLLIPSLLNSEWEFDKINNYSNPSNQSRLYYEQFTKRWIDSFYKFYGIWKINVGF